MGDPEFNVRVDWMLIMTDLHKDGDCGGAETLVVVPGTQREERTRPKRQPPYAVIVENDYEHSYAYVIDVISRVCGDRELHRDDESGVGRTTVRGPRLGAVSSLRPH